MNSTSASDENFFPDSHFFKFEEISFSKTREWMRNQIFEFDWNLAACSGRKLLNPPSWQGARRVSRRRHCRGRRSFQRGECPVEGDEEIRAWPRKMWWNGGFSRRYRLQADQATLLLRIISVIVSLTPSPADRPRFLLAYARASVSRKYRPDREPFGHADGDVAVAVVGEQADMSKTPVTPVTISRKQSSLPFSHGAKWSACLSATTWRHSRGERFSAVQFFEISWSGKCHSKLQQWMFYSRIRVGSDFV